MGLHYRELGQGPVPVVILHGLFGSLDNWATIGNRLAERFRVILVDQRNHGRSPHFAEHTYEAMADDLHGLFIELRLENAVLVGHSMGGKTAMTFAHSHAKLLRSLVIIDIGPRAYPVHHDLIIRALQALPLATLQNRNEAEEELSRLIDGPDTVQFLLKNLYRERQPDGSMRFAWRFNLDVIAEEIQEVGIPQPWPCALPTLFIRGTKSDYIRDRDIPEIQRLYPMAGFLSLPTGHWVHAEDPEAVIQAIAGHMK